MTITMPGRFTLGAAVAVLALTALFLAVVATSTGSVQGSEQVCEYDVILMEQVCTSPDGETTLSTTSTSTPTPEPTEETDLARWMPVPDVLHDGSLRPTKEPNVIPPIPPIKNFKYTISTATPKPRVRMLRQIRDVQVQNNQGPQAQAVQAQQTNRVLVKNTNQTNAGNLDLDQDYAQDFTTGGNSNGYKLTSVEIEFTNATSDVTSTDYRVQIANAHITSQGPKPGNAFATLKNPTSLVAGNNEFTATGSGIDLDPGKTYFIFFDAHKNLNTVGTPTSIRSTATDNEDAGAADGWSLGDRSSRRSHSGTFWVGGAQEVQVVVNGFIITPPAPVSAEVTGTTLVLTFDQNLDTASRPAAGQFGIRFGGGALKRATAIAISGKQVTLTVPNVRAGQVVTVSYAKPTSRPLRNTAGLASDSFSDQAVTVNADQVRTAQYVTYNNADGEKEVVENRAASADLDTLLDYFRDSCISRRSLRTVHDYGWFGTYGRMQASNGWRWLERQNAKGEVTHTSPMTIDECVSHSWFERRAFCENLANGIVSLPEGAKENTCPAARNW